MLDCSTLHVELMVLQMDSAWQTCFMMSLGLQVACNLRQQGNAIWKITTVLAQTDSRHHLQDHTVDGQNPSLLHTPKL